jgi:hypothetical protein
MSEEKANDVVPAMLAEGEAVIPAEKVEEFKAVVDEILAAKPVAEEAPAAEVIAESVEDAVVEEKGDIVVEPAASVISSVEPAKRAKPRPSVSNVKDTIASATAEPVVEKKTEKKKSETVAVFSEKNARSNAIGGNIYRGYNLFPKKVADKWLEYTFVRLATPEEVSRVYG